MFLHVRISSRNPRTCWWQTVHNSQWNHIIFPVEYCRLLLLKWIFLSEIIGDWEFRISDRQEKIFDEKQIKSVFTCSGLNFRWTNHTKKRRFLHEIFDQFSFDYRMSKIRENERNFSSMRKNKDIFDFCSKSFFCIGKPERFFIIRTAIKSVEQRIGSVTSSQRLRIFVSSSIGIFVAKNRFQIVGTRSASSTFGQNKNATRTAG